MGSPILRNCRDDLGDKTHGCRIVALDVQPTHNHEINLPGTQERSRWTRRQQGTTDNLTRRHAFLAQRPYY